MAGLVEMAAPEVGGVATGVVPTAQAHSITMKKPYTRYLNVVLEWFTMLTSL
jgi:hypothetical protein